MIVNDPKDHVLCSQCKKFHYESGPYQCKQGHMICPRCQPLTNICAKCFIFVDVDDPIRCHSAVDFLMDKVPVPCIYKLNGCMEKKQRAEIRQHVVMCPFRNQANVERTGATEAGAIVGGDDAETVEVTNMNDQSEGTVSGTGGHDSENDAEKAKSAVKNEGTVGIGSVDIRKEHNYVEIEDDDKNEENTGGAVDIGNEGDTGKAVDMAGRNVEKRGTGGSISANTDDYMEVQKEQNQENDGADGDNDMVMLAVEGEVDNGMEEVEVDRDARVEEDDAWMEEEDSGSLSVQLMGSRKRKRLHIYSWPTAATNAAPVVEDNSETVFHNHDTRLQINYLMKLSKADVTESVFVDPFECTICGLKFLRKSRVTSHLASYHSAPVTEEINEKIAVYRCCMFCDSRFIFKDDLRKHISDMHKGKFETGSKK